jgi:transposase-like protein
MKCPKCSESDFVKNGKAYGKQRFKCKLCGNNFTVELKSYAKPKATKRLALQMYLEGLGFHSIARLLNVSHVAVQKWIKAFGKEIEHYKNDSPVKIVEMDELHTYIGRKKTTVGYGLLLIEMGENSSTSIWVPGVQIPANNYGKR